MRKFIRQLLAPLPLDFRVLCRQFLLRVIDLEALSVHADVDRYLGQFAGVLIMLSLINVLRASVFISKAPLYIEQSLIEWMMLVVGLITIISWESTFPDRRDAMILGPLPIAPRTILFAKVTASAAILGLAVVSLNCAAGLACPILLAARHGSGWGFFQSFAAYWFTMTAASLFLFCSVLTVQGFTALLLSRRAFLRISAFLQLTAFGLFLGVYFLEPSVPTAAAMRVPQNHWVFASSPPYWFLALFNQLNGSLPGDVAWLAQRAWIGMGVALFGAAGSLLLCYLRTMKKTVEEPDLVPGARGLHWTPRFGSRLQTAIVLFSVRSLARSRYHRVAFALFFALVAGLAFSTLHQALSVRAFRPLTWDFLLNTVMMMSLAVIGLRGIFSLPVSLNANWVLRLTQLRPSEEYIAASRLALLLLAALPAWLCAALLSLLFRPLYEPAAHLAVLALVGFIMVDLSLIGASKIPFACSYLPGKTNFQYMFWGFLVIVAAIGISFSQFEERALHHPFQYVAMIGVFGALAVGLWTFNRHRAKSAVLYYEELPPEVITTLGLTLARAPIVEPHNGQIVP